MDDNYQSPLPEEYRWRNWAKNAEGLTGEKLKNFIDNDLFPALQTLTSKTENPMGTVIFRVFEDAYNYMKSGQLIRQMINIDAHARSSMADDLALERPTAIDALCGEVVRLAQRVGRGAPHNARIAALERTWPQRRQPHGPHELMEALGL